MAVTAGTTGPIVPFSTGGNGKSAIVTGYYAVAASQTVAVGDVLTFSAGKVSVNNAATSAIVGIAMNAKTTGGSPTDADIVEVAMALPGSLFVGSFVTDVNTDETAPAYADLIAGTAANFKDLAELNGYPVIINASVNDICELLFFARDQFRGLNFKSGASGTVNPRIVFRFNPVLTIHLT